MGFIAEIGYCPSKYGLEGLTQCLAMELHQHNIAVNTLNVAAPEGKRLKPSRLTQVRKKNYRMTKGKVCEHDQMVRHSLRPGVSSPYRMHTV